MLRVYSILYLQQVWERPDKNQLVSEEVLANASENLDSSTPSIDNETVVAAGREVEEEESLLYGTVNIVSSATTSTVCNSGNEQPLVVAQAPKEEDNKGNHLSISSDELSCSNSCLNTSTNGKANSLISIPVLPPSRSETPSTQHHEDFFSSTTTNSVLMLNSSKIEREFYDDDISSDTDEQEEAEEQENLEAKTAPRTNSKFSPKRILHRAKSSINEESVKKIGRRTSLFLEKFNQLHQQQQQQQSSVSPLPPINNIHENAKNSNIKEDFSRGLRRQSSKLTVKGKTFTKKIKRVLSFHQPATTATAAATTTVIA